MDVRCSSSTKEGNPCRGRAWRDELCLSHHPAQAQNLAEARRRGGEEKSNRKRARKSAIALAMTPAELGGVLSDVLRRTIAGELEPGVATAAASLSRAMLTVKEATETEERLNSLEEAISGLGARTGNR